MKRYPESLNDINYASTKTDVEEYTKLLCIVATVHHRAENDDKAAEAFKEASSLIEKHQFSDTTDAYTKWIETQRAIGITNEVSAPRAYHVLAGYSPQKDLCVSVASVVIGP